MRYATLPVPYQRRARLFMMTLLLLTSALLALPRTASAHAVLQTSTPAANATLDAAKLAGNVPIVLTFNSRIDAAHSSLSLLKPDGKPVSLAIDTKTDANILRGHAAGIQPGHYSLRWQVVAGDGHITRGAISFDVR